MAVPHGMVALIWPRSGLAGKHGIDIHTATAQQLAWDRAREMPNQKDIDDAAEMVARWNIKRIEMGLMPWE